jgi:antitoxin component YwqK of YwqJK toxin-antitoxin module
MDPMWLDRDLADKMEEGIAYEMLDYDEGIGVYYLNGDPFTGVTKLRGRDGKLEALSHFKGGVEYGVAVAWYPNGQIYLYNEMEGNACHGWHIEWNEDGTRRVESYYQHGRRSEPPR